MKSYSAPIKAILSRRAVVLKREAFTSSPLTGQDRVTEGVRARPDKTHGTIWCDGHRELSSWIRRKHNTVIRGHKKTYLAAGYRQARRMGARFD